MTNPDQIAKQRIETAASELEVARAALERASTARANAVTAAEEANTSADEAAEQLAQVKEAVPDAESTDSAAQEAQLTVDEARKKAQDADAALSQATRLEEEARESVARAQEALDEAQAAASHRGPATPATPADPATPPNPAIPANPSNPSDEPVYVVATEAARPMGFWWRTVTVLYTLAVVILSGWTLVRLWQGATSDSGATQQVLNPADEPQDGSPHIAFTTPERPLFADGLPDILLSGFNFDSTSTVMVGGVERETRLVSENALLLTLLPHDYIPGSFVQLIVQNAVAPDTTGAGTGVAPLASAVYPLPIRSERDVTISWTPPLLNRREVTYDTRLLLLVFLTGVFGASIMALQSFSDYRGERALTQSWTTHYFARPPLGGGIAVVFYLVVRGGLMSGTEVDVGAATPYGVLAISALVGMFSDKAIRKLREVFLTLFKSEDTLGENLESNRRSEPYTVLPGGIAGDQYRVSLRARCRPPPVVPDGETWAVWDVPEGLTVTAKGLLAGTLPSAGRYAVVTQITYRMGETYRAEMEVEVSAPAPSTEA